MVNESSSTSIAYGNANHDERRAMRDDGKTRFMTNNR